MGLRAPLAYDERQMHVEDIQMRAPTSIVAQSAPRGSMVRRPGRPGRGPERFAIRTAASSESHRHIALRARGHWRGNADPCRARARSLPPGRCIPTPAQHIDLLQRDDVRRRGGDHLRDGPGEMRPSTPRQRWTFQVRRRMAGTRTFVSEERNLVSADQRSRRACDDAEDSRVVQQQASIVHAQQRRNLAALGACCPPRSRPTSHKGATHAERSETARPGAGPDAAAAARSARHAARCLPRHADQRPRNAGRRSASRPWRRRPCRQDPRARRFPPRCDETPSDEKGRHPLGRRPFWP